MGENVSDDGLSRCNNARIGATTIRGASSRNCASNRMR